MRPDIKDLWEDNKQAIMNVSDGSMLFFSTLITMRAGINTCRIHGDFFTFFVFVLNSKSSTKKMFTYMYSYLLQEKIPAKSVSYVHLIQN